MLTGVNIGSGDWPLEKKRLEKLNTNCRQLVKQMHLKDGLLDDMASYGCITMEQKAAVEELNSTSAEKNRKVQEILMRRSVAHYKLFLTCLHLNGHSHLANCLTVDEGKNNINTISIVTINHRMNKYNIKNTMQ